MEIPVWLFYALECRLEPMGQWNEQKEKLAEAIIDSLKDSATREYWKPEVLERVLHYNKHDDCTPYGARTLHGLKPLRTK